MNDTRLSEQEGGDDEEEGGVEGAVELPCGREVGEVLDESTVELEELFVFCITEIDVAFSGEPGGEGAGRCEAEGEGEAEGELSSRSTFACQWGAGGFVL